MVLLIPLLAAALWGGNVLGVRDRFFPPSARLPGRALNQIGGESITQEEGLKSEHRFDTSTNLTRVASDRTGCRSSTMVVAVVLHRSLPGVILRGILWVFGNLQEGVYE
jgi:hypothetical protein